MEAENREKADVVDCQQNGYKGLQGAVIKDRYKIIKSLSEGSHGYIYMIEDMNAGNLDKVKALKV
jgi:hypothetical protein